ncbi:hypothetical protein GALL_336940 [mine drainage metagenome]|uniref:Uncharacterized protein n=1 Tax=mine drainage metagenome TaxID=410659 RepID=A0A1J5QXA3_9ZZZZ
MLGCLTATALTANINICTAFILFVCLQVNNVRNLHVATVCNPTLFDMPFDYITCASLKVRGFFKYLGIDNVSLATPHPLH